MKHHQITNLRRIGNFIGQQVTAKQIKTLIIFMVVPTALQMQPPVMVKALLALHLHNVAATTMSEKFRKTITGSKHLIEPPPIRGILQVSLIRALLNIIF